MAQRRLRMYERLERLTAWRRRHLTPAGSFLLGAAAVSLALGLDTRHSLGLPMATLGGGVLLVGALIATLERRRSGSGISVVRHLPARVVDGIPFGYRLEVRGGPPGRALLVLDGVERPLVAEETFRAYVDPADATRPAFDRWMGYERWRRLADLRQGLRPAPVEASSSLTGTAEAMASVLPLRRGYVRFTGVRIAWPEPLGLVRSVVARTLPQSLLVLPARRMVPAVPFAGTRREQPGGVAQARTVGETGEFMSLRDWRQGDGLRRVHWRRSARVGRLLVREHREEFLVRHALLLDTEPPAGQDPEIFEEAVRVAASYVEDLGEGEALVDLLLVGRKAYRFEGGRRLGEAAALLEVLACVAPAAAGSLADLSRLGQAHAGQASGFVCVLLAWDEARQGLVAGLLGQGRPVFAVVVAPAGAALAPEPGPLASHPEWLRVLTPTASDKVS